MRAAQGRQKLRLEDGPAFLGSCGFEDHGRTELMSRRNEDILAAAVERIVKKTTTYATVNPWEKALRDPRLL